MELLELKLIISGMAVVTTVLQFLSGVLVCKQYVVNRTTGEASPLPFICGILSTGLWLIYGLSKNDNTIVLVNVIGIVLMTVYTVVFYKFTSKKKSTLRQAVFTLVCLSFAVGYVRVEEHKELVLRRVGLSACVLTLLTVAAPMSKLLHVLRVKSTDCLPFPMILMSFFVSSLWFVYGTIEHDDYLVIPNLVGGCLALLQLFLFVIFPRTPKRPLLVRSGHV